MEKGNQVYLEFNFEIDPLQPASEILCAELGELNFDSFVETQKGIQAYIKKENFDAEELESVYILNNPDFKIQWQSKEVEQQNWNAVWERSFLPIHVSNRCVVRAPFHSSQNAEYEIVIEPKMSFGTGHHETTYMMLKMILEDDFSEKSVLDMGCGTGVLAILTEMKGAIDIDAVDIDHWCYLNSLENVKRNNCNLIRVIEGDSNILGDKKYNTVLANINRNILLKDIPEYVKVLKKGGALYLSGFYIDDFKKITSCCERNNLRFVKKSQKNQWVAAKYVL